MGSSDKYKGKRYRTSHIQCKKGVANQNKDETGNINQTRILTTTPCLKLVRVKLNYYSVPISQFIPWQAPRVGKLNQIAQCDWLPEQASWSYLAHSGLRIVSRKNNSPKSHIITPLVPKFIQSRWLDIGLFLFCKFMDLDFASIHKHPKKNLANIQPS